MKAIQIGNDFSIYSDNIKTYEKLPAQTYIVRFSEFHGFSLEAYFDFEIKEDKVYGVHEEKVNKVLNNYKKFNRNLGVILSGNKGIGKSLFAKMLAKKAVENGIPVIVVDRFVPGINSYLESIDQEVMVLFDEFDKTFGNIKTGDNQANPQAGMLSLFDGISMGKKLFVITCNDLFSLNDYLINRPGRFHYHFRFSYPSPEEVKEYLNDKLEKKYYGEISKVVSFAQKTDLNYDCLRAIAFELNNGEPFESAIEDLNIINLNQQKYVVSLHFTNGEIHTARNCSIDLFNPGAIVHEDVVDRKGNDIISVEFNTANCTSSMRGSYVVAPSDIKLTYDTTYYNDEEVAAAKALEVDFLEISREKERNFHYMV